MYNIRDIKEIDEVLDRCWTEMFKTLETISEGSVKKTLWICKKSKSYGDNGSIVDDS